MTNVPILKPIARWECPSCGFTDVTTEVQPHSRMHSCSALKGLTTPMVRLKPGQISLTKNEVTHTVVERGDYIGEEQGIPVVDGKAVMAVRTERKDGSNDIAVFAPTAARKVTK